MTEQQAYTVIDRRKDFEVREYPAAVVAQIEVRSSFDSAGSKAFRSLVSFIGGANSSGEKIAMTSPVIQEPTDDNSVQAVSFVMPNGSVVESMPSPSNSQVKVTELPAQWAVVRGYSGRWTQTSYRRHLSELSQAATEAGFTLTGSPRYARYDPPWTPWFMRRNEVIVPVEPLPE
ncbi:MAG: SOUL family heme-binding protein [Candidatus Nanopelagicales bacterium]